jgi:hypothetical protein
MGDRNTENSTPHLTYPGQMAMWLTYCGIPRLLHCSQCPQPTIAAYGKKLAQDVGEGPGTSTVRVCHAGFSPFPPRAAGRSRPDSPGACSRSSSLRS